MGKFKKYYSQNKLVFYILLFFIIISITSTLSLLTNKNLYILFDWQIAILIITVLANAVVLVDNNDKSTQQRAIEIITSNRVLWMQELKKYYVELSGIIRNIYDGNSVTDKEKCLEEFNDVYLKIKLHLNIKGDADKEIINNIKTIQYNFKLSFILEKCIAEYDYNYVDTKDDEYLLFHSCIQLFNGYLNINDVKNFYGYGGIKEEFSHLKRISCKYSILIREGEYDEINIGHNCIEHIYDFIKENKVKLLKEIDNITSKLEILIQIYIKIEWERVKHEAEFGLVNSFSFNNEFKKYKEQFINTLKGDIKK